jgi:hypothetical protein
VWLQEKQSLGRMFLLVSGAIAARIRVTRTASTGIGKRGGRESVPCASPAAAAPGTFAGSARFTGQSAWSTYSARENAKNCKRRYRHRDALARCSKEPASQHSRYPGHGLASACKMAALPV